MAKENSSSEESSSSEIAQIDFDLEVLRSEDPPIHIAMNPKLLEAARSGDKTILDELLQQKDFSFGALMGEIKITVPEDAIIQQDTNCLLGATSEGNTALHIVASRGYLELAKEICNKDRSLLAAPNMRHDTPLHCAARAGNDKMVSLFIELIHQMDSIEARRVLRATNKNKDNALHEAAKYDHMYVAEVLMKEDADLASMLDNAGMSPLYLAIVIGSLNVAKALLRSSSWVKASPTYYAGPNGETALHQAVCISQEITKEILQREPDITKVADLGGGIPLHFVAYNGDRDTAKLLLEHDPSTANVSNANGFCPIHVAARSGKIGVVDQILQQCPDADELLDKEGKNFLHAAFQCRKLNVVKKIISKRPNLRKLLNDQDHEGNTPLHTAVKNSDQSSVHFLLRDKGVSPNIINHDGFTPLDLAMQKMDGGMQFRLNTTWCILGCLAFTKGLFGSPVKRVVFSSDEDKMKPSGDDKVKENSSSGEKTETKVRQDEELQKELDVSKNLVIATVLIATVTFTARLTVPGGYIADDHPDRGTAVLSKENAFKVFLVSDALAFVCSISATCWLLFAGTSTVDKYTRRRALSFASLCLWVAFNGMSTAFATGIYATVAHSCKRISFLSCITPLCAFALSTDNVFNVMKTVGIRQGTDIGFGQPPYTRMLKKLFVLNCCPSELQESCIYRSLLLLSAY
uniref:Ankyrin repeat-containing protein At5g02620 n=1 Tax=Elaeis guineensis var. tenera TaxID=51953 RepID=A0A8N4I687_ELAGV|nr:ankyrin repeat-containing protein At5g02620 [Elaeis guineensis]